MTMKDFMNLKKPYIWITIVTVVVLIFAGVVSVLDKEKTDSVDVPPQDIEVEVEEPVEEVKKEDHEIILDRFSKMDWNEVKENAKGFGEEGWQDGIVRLTELPEENLTLYGYNDAEYKLQGVAIDHDGNVSFYDWVYMSESEIQPEMYWNEAEKQLQVTLNLSIDENRNYEELHLLQEYDSMTLEDFSWKPEEYIPAIEEKLDGLVIGSYTDIQLGKKIKIQFIPVSGIEGVETPALLYEAEVIIVPHKDETIFEVGEVGMPPEKRSAEVMIEGMPNTYTEVSYVSENDYFLWYPEELKPADSHGNEAFVYMTEDGETIVNVTIVPGQDMKLGDKYLKSTANNFKKSGEYEKVTISKIQKLKSDSKNVSIRMISVTHDDTADCFYIVKDKTHTLLVTVSMPAEALEGWGVRVDEMIKTIAFAKVNN